MAKAQGEWRVLSHGPIVKLAENLWWVQGTLPNMSLKRNMTVAKRRQKVVAYVRTAILTQASDVLIQFGD